MNKIHAKYSAIWLRRGNSDTSKRNKCLHRHKGACKQDEHKGFWSIFISHALIKIKGKLL